MNAFNRMIDSGLNSAEFIAFSTNKFALQLSKAAKKISLGTMRYGLDGGSPSRSEQAAIESRDEILSALRGANVVIIVAGLGGDDGTGAAPVVASCAREIGALTVAVVTLPYRFEGPKRTAKADAGLKNLSAHVDTVIKIRNDKILHVFDPKTPMSAAFKCLDEILCRAVKTLLAVFQNAFRTANPLPNKFSARYKNFSLRYAKLSKLT